MTAQPALIRTPSRDKILDAAETLFARRGFAGIGIAEVADAVGLSKSSLFHHFRSKAQLYAAVMARILQRIEARVVEVIEGDGSPADRLERAIEELIDVLAAHPAYPRLLLRSLFEDDELAGDLPEELEANDAIRRLAGALGRVLQQGVEAGEVRPTSTAHTLQTLIGATVYHFASGDFGDELVGRPIFSAAEVKRRKDEVRSFIRHGLVIPPAAPSRRPRRIR